MLDDSDHTATPTLNHSPCYSSHTFQCLFTGRVVTRRVVTGRVRRFPISRGSSGAGSGDSSDCHRSAWVGPGVFCRISRVVSGHPSPGPTRPCPREVTRPVKSPEYIPPLVVTTPSSQVGSVPTPTLTPAPTPAPARTPTPTPTPTPAPTYLPLMITLSRLTQR